MLCMEGWIYNTWLCFFQPEATKTLKDLQRSLMQNSFGYLPQILLYIFIINFFLSTFHTTSFPGSFLGTRLYFTQHILSVTFECIQVNEKFLCKGLAFQMSGHSTVQSLVPWPQAFPMLLQFWYISLRQMSRCECIFALFACSAKDYLHEKYTWKQG